jgi:hypothetical protein
MPPQDPNSFFGAHAQLQQQQLEMILEGLLEQIEMDDDSGETAEFVRKAFASVQKILLAEAARGASDSALSFNTDGTFLLAFDTVSLAEIQKLVGMILDFAGEKVAPFAVAFDIDFTALVKQNYETVENFKVSNFRVPMEKVAALVPDEGVIQGVTPGAFWAVKDARGKQAIAVAAGLDFTKTERTFKSALEKTKTPAPVQKPEGMVSVQGLGKFFQQTVYPIAEQVLPPDENVKKMVDILASAGNDATLTFTSDIKGNEADTSFNISGKAIEAVVSAVKLGVELATQNRKGSSAIQDF